MFPIKINFYSLCMKKFCWNQNKYNKTYIVFPWLFHCSTSLLFLFNHTQPRNHCLINGNSTLVFLSPFESNQIAPTNIIPKFITLVRIRPKSRIFTRALLDLQVPVIGHKNVVPDVGLDLVLKNVLFQLLLLSHVLVYLFCRLLPEIVVTSTLTIAFENVIVTVNQGLQFRKLLRVLKYVLFAQEGVDQLGLVLREVFL